MKRILCISIVLTVLLTACSAPTQAPEPTAQLHADYTHGVYELVFSVQQISGSPFEEWDFVYMYNGTQIQNGYQILLPAGVFSFYSVQVNVIERNDPENVYSATFPVAIYSGGSGNTEITATDSNGKTATFRVVCDVVRIDG